MKVTIITEAFGKVSRFELSQETGLMTILGRMRSTPEAEATAILATLPTLIRAVWDTHWPDARVAERLAATSDLLAKLGLLVPEPDADPNANQPGTDEVAAEEFAELAHDRQRWHDLAESRATAYLSQASELEQAKRDAGKLESFINSVLNRVPERFQNHETDPLTNINAWLDAVQELAGAVGDWQRSFYSTDVMSRSTVIDAINRYSGVVEDATRDIDPERVKLRPRPIKDNPQA